VRSRVFLVILALLVVLVLFPWFAGASASVEVEARIVPAVQIAGSSVRSNLPVKAIQENGLFTIVSL